MSRCGLWALPFAGLCLTSATAASHPSKSSAVLVDFSSDRVDVEMQLPVDQLELALDHTLSTDADTRDRELQSYVLSHCSLTRHTGERLQLKVGESRLVWVDDAWSVSLKLTARFPEGVAEEGLTLRDDVILERVVTHRIFVSVRFDSGPDSAGANPVGVIGFQRESIELAPRVNPRPAAGLGPLMMVTLGFCVALLVVTTAQRVGAKRSRRAVAGDQSLR